MPVFAVLDVYKPVTFLCTVMGQNSLERGDFSAQGWSLCQTRALAIPGMDERDY